MKQQYSPNDMVKSGLCIGCGSCVAQANSTHVQATFDKQGFYKPKGPSEWLNKRTERFSLTCPFSPAAANETVLSEQLFPTAQQRRASVGRYQSAYVGSAAEDYRTQGSSGGMVSWVAAELLRQGLVDGVAHVFATENPQEAGRFFQYQISRTEADIRKGAKSRYYPVELSQILQTIRDVPGRYAIVGIPCFIKSVQLLRSQDPVLRERITFTLGLFCGHMKSARFVESFAWQMKVPVNDISRVEFRYKDPNRPANWYNAMLTLKNGQVINKDWWHLVDGDWGAGFFMNEACNFCDDVIAETSDISFGDAWVEPYSSDGRGTNVVVVRAPVMEDLIKNGISDGRLQLQEVDSAFVEQTQAAGFRQRREGLSYRLKWAPTGIQPIKRVVPGSIYITDDRKRIYRMRYRISKWSNRMFNVARKARLPIIYLWWARLAASVYHGIAYHKGKLSEMVKRFTTFK